MKRYITLLFLSVMLTACSSSQSTQATNSTMANQKSGHADHHKSDKKVKKKPSQPSNQKKTTSKKHDDQSAAKKANPQKSTKLKKAIPTNLIPVTVAREVDGDTLHVTMPNGTDQDLRLLLIDTPEDVDPFKPIEPFSYKASAFAKQELPVGKRIYIQEGKAGYKRGKYNRLLAYVYITPSDMYNVDVVKKGLARVAYIYPPNTDHLSQLKSAQSYAKDHHLGIWSLSGYVVNGKYSLSYSCHWAARNGYATHGCPNTSIHKSSSGSSGSSSSSHSTGSASHSSSAKIVASNLNISPGAYASVTVQGNPGSSASIEVDYKSGPSHASGLESKTVPSSGKVTWQWKVGSRTTPGNWTVYVTVGGKSISTTLHVQ